MRRSAPGRTFVMKTSALLSNSSAVDRPSSRRDIECDAALAAVVHLEGRTLVAVEAEHAAEHPGRVTGRRFDLDDVGSPVRQDAARGRARHPYAELDDLDALQRTGHPNPFRRALYKIGYLCNACVATEQD